jgi:hypothetical protein
MGVIAEVKLTKVCFEGKFTAKFQSTTENVVQPFTGTRRTKNINKPMPRNRLATSEIVCGTIQRPKQLPVSICNGTNRLKHVNGER